MFNEKVAKVKNEKKREKKHQGEVPKGKSGSPDQWTSDSIYFLFFFLKPKVWKVKKLRSAHLLICVWRRGGASARPTATGGWPCCPSASASGAPTAACAPAGGILEETK